MSFTPNTIYDVASDGIFGPTAIVDPDGLVTTLFETGTGPDNKEGGCFKVSTTNPVPYYYYETDNGNYILTDTEDDSLGFLYLTLNSSSIFLGIAGLDNGMIMTWATATPVITIGGFPVTFSLYASYGSWRLYFSEPITSSGDLILTTHQNEICYFDVRGTNGEYNLKTMEYYYRDIVDNSGNSTLPLF